MSHVLNTGISTYRRPPEAEIGHNVIWLLGQCGRRRGFLNSLRRVASFPEGETTGLHDPRGVGRCGSHALDSQREDRSAGLAGTAIVAGSTVIAEPAEVARLADRNNVFVVGTPAGTGQ